MAAPASAPGGALLPALHVTNGDAVAPELEAVVAPDEVLVWRDVLHDGPVPAGLDAGALAQVRARHLSRHGETAALAMLRERDARLAAHPPEAEVVLWFEDDLFDHLLRAQVEDRLAGRQGPVTRVFLRHPPRGDLRAALAEREPVEPDAAMFAALRSPDPRAWLDIPELERLLEELPDARTALTRLERQILEALGDGPIPPEHLFAAVAAQEDPPWVGDATVFALAADLRPLVTLADGRYELTPEGNAVLGHQATRPRVDRWLGGVHLGPGMPDWAWDADARRPVRLD